MLEPAPATSLREAAPGEQWDGFWSVADERFYTRCVSAGGRERWFRIGDVSESGAGDRSAARVLRLPLRAPRAPRMMVGRYRGQAMLVGTRQRRQPTGER